MQNACLRDLRKADILEEALRDQIRRGILKTGGKLLPEREISRKYQTSRGVVRKVLAKLVGEGMFERHGKAGTILKSVFPERGHAAELKKLLCVFLPSGNGLNLHRFPYFEAVYGGAEKEALTQNCEMTIFFGAAARQRVAGLVRCEKAEPFDGALVSGSGLEPVIGDLKKAGIPFVVVDTGGKETDLNCVYPDNVQSGYLAARHLMELGHRKIGALYSVFPGEDFIQRGYLEQLAGFQAALREAGIKSDKSLIVPLLTKGSCDLTDESYARLGKFLSPERQITGIFLAADNLAPCVYRTAASKGIIIPDQISVIGFGDTEVCSLLNPELTAVKVDRFAMGQKAFLMLKSLVENRDQPASCQVLPVELVRRASTAAPK